MSAETAPRCSVYLEESSIFVIGAGLTVEGFLITTLPCFSVEVDADDRQLGTTVLQALAAFRDDLPQSEFTDAGNRVPNALGLKSWNALERGSRLLAVTREANQAIVYPYRRVKDHFTLVEGAEAKAPAEPQAVGALIRKTAGVCES